MSATRDTGDPGYLHLNRDGRWPGFTWRGLEPDAEGRLRLRALPSLRGPLPVEIDRCAAGEPAGVTVGADGTVYWCDPERGVVHRITRCKDRLPEEPVEQCLEDRRGPGRFADDGERGRPVAVVVLERRRALLVADAAHHRLDRYALGDLQWLGSWGRHGSGEGELDVPTGLAVDETGAVYVVDSGNERVQKIDEGGRAVPSFWDRVVSTTPAPGVASPVSIAVGSEAIWLLGADGALIAVEADGRWRATIDLGLAAAFGIAVTPSGIYVGGPQDRRLWRFDRSPFESGGQSYERVGAARGYRGPVAGLAVDRRGTLWLAPGCGLAPLPLDPGAAFVERGVLWGGPISDGDPIADSRARCWQRLAPVGHGLDDPGSHLQWFFAAADDASPPPDPDLDQPLPFDPSSWTALAQDVADVWIGAESRALWLGALIESTGAASPTLANLRLDHDREGYLPHLPAIYQSRTRDLDGLQRFLGLFESFFADAEGTIDRLERLFDPWVAPVEWLPWLAGWLAVDLDEAWPERSKREVIASAWDRHRWRGTARGLRSALRIYAGLEGLVEEPILGSSWWALAPEGTGSDSATAEASVLGFSTRLAASEPAGAVLGSSAVLDQSRLLAGDEYGRVLFDATAHQLTVRVHRRQLSDVDHLERVRLVVEREKPAHTHAHLCVIQPRLRVGFQARLGVDTVIGGGAREAGLLGVDRPAGSAAEPWVLALGGEAPGRLGDGSRVGQTTRLGAQPVEPRAQCPSDERRIHGRSTGP